MKPVRTALVGPGRIARAHLTAIKHNADVAELIAIAGVPQEIERTRALAAEFGAAKALEDVRQLWADKDIEAVVLTLPNHLHEPMARAAFQAGKHVLIEKPLANTTAEAASMIVAAEQAGRVLMVGQCRRFFPAARLAKQRLHELGRPLNIVHILGVNVEGPLVDWWRSASDTGGLAIGLNGPHVIDTILWYVGQRPTRVYAQTARFKQVGWEGEDEASIQLTFGDGSMATGHVSFNMLPHTNERWITGPNGMMRLVDDRTLYVNGEKVAEGELVPYINGDESFDNQFREFVSAIREGRAPIASGKEVYGVVEVLSAALKSAKTNEPVVLGEKVIA